MSGVNSKYIAAFSFAEVILDKDNAAPLAGGLVTFYKDTQRTVKKDIFQLTNSGVYEYVPLPNPIVLSSIGTFQDNSGNDIVPYFYPYDGGTLDLYYITFYSSDDGVTPGVFQFDREAVPSSAITGSTSEISNVKNYVTNGQFLLHTNIPETGTSDAGEITAPVTILSQGGMTFERSVGSTAKDIVKFNPIASSISNPTGNPKFTANFICYIPDISTSFKSFRVKFPDVNKFVLTGDPDFTFSLAIKSNASTPNVEVKLIKNYGTGGSPSAEDIIPLETVTLTGSFLMTNITFKFGNNLSKTLGTNGDDYIQFEVAFPTASSYDIEITDVSLQIGAISSAQYPMLTNQEMIYGSIAGWEKIPAYDASDLYLPVLLSPTGLTYDYSVIGKIESTMCSTLGIGELWADGSGYKTSARSSDGIPYSRLQAKLWSPSIQTPISGTGVNYVTSVFAGTALHTGNELVLSNNDKGPVTNTSDGAIPTGFTFTNIHAGDATGYYVLSYVAPFLTYSGVPNPPPLNQFYIESLEAGDASASSGNSGFTIYDNHLGHEGNTNILRNVIAIETVSPAASAGKYFTFFTKHSGSSVNYYVWFKVDGIGSDPAPGGTGILVALNSIDNPDTVAIKIAEALNGWQNTSVKTLAASAITAGSYFTFHVPSGQQYYVWYKKDGSGSEPVIAGAIGVEVAILAADTNVQVASKTQAAINMLYYAVPDYRGLFLRGTGGSLNQWDLYANTRYSMVPGYYGDVPGTYQLDQNMLHSHTVPTEGATGGSGGNTYAAAQQNSSQQSGLTGEYESRPVSASVNYIIKY